MEGSATEAQFDNPDGLALDSEGTLYVADCMNHRIHKILIPPFGIPSSSFKEDLLKMSNNPGLPSGMATFVIEGKREVPHTLP
jgi:sugar lactone lactonase YvrE